MNNRPRQDRATLLRFTDRKTGAAKIVTDDLTPRPMTWFERLGWALFGLVVLAIWVRVGMWLWDLIAH